MKIKKKMFDFWHGIEQNKSVWMNRVTIETWVKMSMIACMIFEYLPSKELALLDTATFPKS